MRVYITRSRSLRKRKNIASNGCSTSNKRVRTDADKMVYWTESTYRGPLFDRDVAAESRRVGKDNVIADRAIVGDVRVSHNQYMVAHAGQSATFCGAAINGNELANLVVVTNLRRVGSPV